MEVLQFSHLYEISQMKYWTVLVRRENRETMKDSSSFVKYVATRNINTIYLPNIA